jgi:hypothetical protein
METAPQTPHLARLADMLWFERRLLEFLLFKLVSANLVLTANDRRFVGPAVAEVERVVVEVRRAETDRAEVLQNVARDWGVDVGLLSLDYIAQHAPVELQPDFQDHHEGFLALVGEIETLTQENRRLATVSLDDIRSSFGLSESGTYDAAGRRRAEGPERPASINRII